MRVAYINLPMNERRFNRKDRKQRYGGIGNHLGIGYLGAVTRELGHEVILFDCPNDNINLNQLVELLNEGCFDIVGISPYYTSLVTMARLLNAMKTAKKPFIIVGGHYASMVPEHFLSNFPQIDCIAAGEGEYVITDIVNSVANNNESWKSARGVIYRDGSKIVRNERALLIEDLDKIPHPMRNIIPNQKVTPVIASRGCHEKCGFCDVWSFYRKCEGARFRWRSAKNVAGEIIELSRKGLKYFDIIDDNFLGIEVFQKGWVDTFVEEIKKANIDIMIEINTRADTVDKEILLKLKSIGLVEVGFGAENASQKVLDYFSKNTTVQQVIECFHTIRSVGVKLGPSFVFFEPTSTLDEILLNIQFLRTIGIKDFSNGMPLSMYRPLVLEPGTPIYNLFRNNNKLLNKYPGYEFENKEIRLLWNALQSYQNKIVTVTNYILNSFEEDSSQKDLLMEELIMRELDFIEQLTLGIKNNGRVNEQILSNLNKWLDSYTECNK